MLYVARILTPDDFGLIAMAMIPIGLARMVEDFGLDAVIVQDRNLTSDQLAQLGGLAVLVGISISLIFLALAHPLSEYYKEPTVAQLIMILSVIFIADSLQILPRALLQRDLAFRRLAWINALQMVVTSGALGIYASLGFSYWSLALNTITGSCIITFVLLFLRPHKLSIPRQIKSLVPSMKSGMQLLLSRISWYGYSNLDQVIIGRYLGKADLGAYSFSMTFARVPLDEVVAQVGKVIPGVFTTVQTDLYKLRRYFLMLTELLSYITFPMAIGLMLTADDFVNLVIGPQWGAVILPLRILCVYIIFHVAQTFIGHVFLWTGKFKLNMYLSFLALAFLSVGFYLGTSWGLEGVAWSWVIFFPLTEIPAVYFLLKIIEMKISEWGRALLPAAVGCLVMSVSVLVCRYALPEDSSHGLRLAVQSAIGAISYTLLMFTFYKSRIIKIWKTIRGEAEDKQIEIT